MISPELLQEIIIENASEINYASYQVGGIIKMTEIGDAVNTTHQYIKMDIYATVGGQNAKVGTAIFYNINYAGN